LAATCDGEKKNTRLLWKAFRPVAARSITHCACRSRSSTIARVRMKTTANE
jgi:hypothetical protein